MNDTYLIFAKYIHTRTNILLNEIIENNTSIVYKITLLDWYLGYDISISYENRK